MAKKTETVEIEGLEDAGTEPRVYELGFHLDPELPQEEVKKTYQTIHDGIAAVGTIVAEGEPTKIPLAYTISRMNTSGRRDFDTAFFCWIAYETDGAGHETVATMAREDTRIIRFLDLRSSVDEAKHSAEMQEMFAEAALAAQNEADLAAEEALEPVEAEADVEAPVVPTVEEEAA